MPYFPPPPTVVTDHGGLTGLVPDDDHTQYVINEGRAGSVEIQADGDVASGGSGTIRIATGGSNTTPAIFVLAGNPGRVGFGTETVPDRVTIVSPTGERNRILMTGSYAGTSGIDTTNSEPTGSVDMVGRNSAGGLITASITGPTAVALPSTAIFGANGVTSVVLASNTAVATGGTTPIYLRAGGYNTVPGISVSAGNPGKVAIGSATVGTEQLKVAGGIELTGNIVMAALATVDGVDVSVHAADTTIHFTKSSVNLDDLGDVVITTPQAGQLIKYNGTNWINSALEMDVVTGNIVLSVTTTGDDTDVARPDVIGSGDYTANPFLTLRAALAALPRQIPPAYSILVNVGAGTFDGCEIKGFVGGGTLTISGATAATTIITIDALILDAAVCIDVQHNQAPIVLEEMTVSEAAMDYGVRVQHCSRVTCTSMKGTVASTFGAIYAADNDSFTLSGYDSVGAGIAIMRSRAVYLSAVDVQDGFCNLDDLQYASVATFTADGCTNIALSLQNIQHALVEAAINTSTTDAMYMSGVRLLEQQGAGIVGATNTGYGINIEQSGTYFLAGTGATLTGTLGDLFVDDVVCDYTDIIADELYDINGILVR
jgi:hypothetical protein